MKVVRLTLVAFATALLSLAASAGGASALSPEVPRAEIVFENGGRIVSMDSDGSNRQVLSRKGRPPLADPWDADHDSDPEVSPDGTKVLFLRTIYSRNRQKIMLVDRDGGVARAIHAIDMRPSRNRDVELYSPAFMPDGSIVVVRSSATYLRRNTRFQDSFVLMGRDGDVVRTVKWRRGAQVSSIDPSPDGGKLLVSGWSRREEQRIETLSLASGKRRVIRGDEAEEGRWSPDGLRIVFTSQHEKLGKVCEVMDGCFYDSKVYVMNSDGSGVRRVVKGKSPGYQLAPDWSGDGNRIAFFGNRNTARRDAGESANIYSVGVDGSCLTWLTNGTPSSTFPVWGPESGESRPARCGAAGRKPLVEMEPRASTRYWLGPVFGTTMFDVDGGRGRGMILDRDNLLGIRMAGLYYGGCSKYSPKDCGDTEYEIGYTGRCSKWPAELLDEGRFASMTYRRGAMVLNPKKTGPYLFDTLVLTGRATLSLNAVSPGGDSARLHRRMIDAIRRVGQESAGGALASPVLDPGLVTKARRIERMRRSGASVRVVADRFDLRAKGVGSWAAFGRALRDLRGYDAFDTASCPNH